MANLGNGGFDANIVEPVSFDAIPAGKYLASIIESELVATKKGDGHYLKLAFSILEGQYKNRRLYTNLNLHNPNAQAVEIARGQLSAVCRAINVMTPKDSQELHGIPLVIDVKCHKREDTGDIQNEIKGFAKRDSAVAATPATPAAGSGATAPWKR
jgi:hypothetical protein